MIRALFRLVLVVVILVGVAAFFFGYRWGGSSGNSEVARPAATSGTGDPVDTTRARQVGAEVGEAVATGANEAKRATADAALTTKIKAKMALDDRVKAANIDVDTAGSTVTLSGRVGTADERARAVQLARDTEGVTSVVDHLTVAATR